MKIVLRPFLSILAVSIILISNGVKAEKHHPSMNSPQNIFQDLNTTSVHEENINRQIFEDLSSTTKQEVMIRNSNDAMTDIKAAPIIEKYHQDLDPIIPPPENIEEYMKY